MLLKHGNLTIRNATAADAGQLAAWWNDGEIMAHAGFPNGTGETARDIAESLESDADDRQRRLIIEIDGVPCGEMSFCNQGGGDVDIGIKICDFSQQNKGYGRVLLSMLIRALFCDLGYKRIVLDTNLKNTRAQHVYERLGFTRLRENKDIWTDQLGNPQSSVDYELYPADFRDFAV